MRGASAGVCFRVSGRVASYSHMCRMSSKTEWYEVVPSLARFGLNLPRMIVDRRSYGIHEAFLIRLLTTSSNSWTPCCNTRCV